ncbi:CcdB family protein [Devosia sp. LjRoot16]|uniref:CcdB family protein n=1 Tax=Devosia sp. LjRoot16 TaxID=3342271 RepID=UPI003ECD90D3
MARFDVHRVNGVYYLDVQSNLLPTMNTRLVVPLVPLDDVPRPLPRLHPIVVVEGVRLVMATHLMVAVPRVALGKPSKSLMPQYDQIVAAIDMIFNGF